MITREDLPEFIETWRKPLIAVTVLVLAILLVVLGVVLAAAVAEKKTAEKLDAERRGRALSMEELWLPPEPLPLPGVQLFRTPLKRWPAEEVKKWYTDADESSLNELHSLNRKKIDTLLESVP